MIARASFSLKKTVVITVASQLAQTMIYLCLCESRAAKPTYHPISGFPRTLVTEDTLNGKPLWEIGPHYIRDAEAIQPHDSTSVPN